MGPKARQASVKKNQNQCFLAALAKNYQQLPTTTANGLGTPTLKVVWQ
jgi:hypothetical protein